VKRAGGRVVHEGGVVFWKCCCGPWRKPNLRERTWKWENAKEWATLKWHHGTSLSTFLMLSKG